MISIWLITAVIVWTRDGWLKGLEVLSYIVLPPLMCWALLLGFWGLACAGNWLLGSIVAGYEWLKARPRLWTSVLAANNRGGGNEPMSATNINSPPPRSTPPSSRPPVSPVAWISRIVRGLAILVGVPLLAAWLLGLAGINVSVHREGAQTRDQSREETRQLRQELQVMHQEITRLRNQPPKVVEKLKVVEKRVEVPVAVPAAPEEMPAASSTVPTPDVVVESSVAVWYRSGNATILRLQNGSEWWVEGSQIQTDPTQSEAAIGPIHGGNTCRLERHGRRWRLYVEYLWPPDRVLWATPR
jgi:hypothetical protein